jgi:hypothetical protein
MSLSFNMHLLLSASGSSISGCSTEMCRAEIGGGEANIVFEPEESLYDEEHDSTDDTESSIAQ